MTIRYIADMHFDNDSIIAYDNRPFDSVEEMNEALVSNWNRVVTDPEDLCRALAEAEKRAHVDAATDYIQKQYASDQIARKQVEIYNRYR